MTSSNADKAKELLDSASTVLLHSGNIASWNKLKKRGPLNSTEVLVSALEATVKSWLGRQCEAEGVVDQVVMRNSGLCQTVAEEEVANHHFAVKIFLGSWDGSMIQQALKSTLGELGLKRVDKVVLSFPPTSDDQLTLANMQPVWKHMEELPRLGVTGIIGTADLFKPQLKELFDWATVKPNIDQVNLAHCCTIPEDLVEFTREHGVDLTSHGDERDILPADRLASSLAGCLGDSVDPQQWRVGWVARYSSVIHLRGIIAHKGYLVTLEKKS